MPQSAKKVWNRSAVVAYSCIMAALALLVAVMVSCIYRDYQRLQAELVHDEVARLRSHAERSVGHIEHELEANPSKDLRDLVASEWLRAYWQRSLPRAQYAAILDVNGIVLQHTDGRRIGERLSREWYNRTLREVGLHVVETRSPALTSGTTALDLHVPIRVGGVEVGEYHTGLDSRRLTQAGAKSRNHFVRLGMLALFAVAIVVGLAVASLYYVATHSVFLRRVIDRAYVERNAEISQLAAGLAHEIRNPLHAIRLNLHTFQRSRSDSSRLSNDEVGRMLDQSSREIERIDRLMQALVGFATPEEAREEEFDVASEIRSVVDFIRQEIEQRKLSLEMNLSDCSISLRMDPGRFRQIMLNLIHNAADALSEGGHIDITCTSRAGVVEILVTDNGPGISEADRKRIFEPFFTTKNNGTGLGLALVKRFVEEANGDIYCESTPNSGTTFRLLLPEIPKPQKRSHRR